MSISHSWFRISYSVLPDKNDPVDSRTNLLTYRNHIESKLIDQLSADCVVTCTVYIDGSQNQVSKIQLVEQGTFDILPSQFLSQDECFLHLLNLKLWSNHLVGQQDFGTSRTNYFQGTNLINSTFQRRTRRDIEQVIVPIYLNLAHCQLKLSQWSEAIKSTSFVIENFDVGKTNIKAYFRRAIARWENRDVVGAKNDLAHILRIDSGNLDAVKLLNQIERDMRNPQVDIKIQIDTVVKTLRFRLHKHLVPRTVENFLLLADRYKECTFFKSVKDQFFQTGDYEFNDGSGGDCAVKEDRVVNGRRFFNDEGDVGKCLERGVIAMANYGPNTNGSQFIITLGRVDSSAKCGVPFGQLVSGWDVIEDINSVSGDPFGDWKTSKPIQIQSVSVV